MSDNTETQQPEFPITGKITISDNWYAIFNTDGKLLAIGTYLPPESYQYRATRVEPDEARVLMDELRLRTIGEDAREFYSIRIASNNRLLMVGTWQPSYPIANIQEDRLMPDQTRDLLEELRVRSEGSPVVGEIEIKN